MADTKTPASIDEYIAGFPPETQKTLSEIRATIRAAAPDAVETISYDIPTYDVNGRHLVFFAGYAKHISVYPVTAGMVEAFGDEVERYHHGKGTLQFPLSEPIPLDLIRGIVEVRLAEESGAAE